MKTNSMLMLGALTWAAACGGSAESDMPSVSTELPQNAHTVAAAGAAVTVAIEGTVQARRKAEISTRLMARVSEVPVDIGSVVRAGQVVVQLGLEDVAIHRARADAALVAARAAREEAARHAARMDTLVAADAVARVQRDQAHLGLAQAESQLAMAEAARSEVQATAEYARITAPFDGRVVSRSVDPGDMAAPGAPLVVIESGGERDAVLAVPPGTATGLAVGASLEVASRDGRTVTGRVRAISGGADAMTRTVEVRVTVPEDWPTGTSVTAFVPTGTRDVVRIPADAVVRRGQLTGVQVVQEGVLLLRWVRLGRSVGDEVEVLSGLEAGEVIAR